MYVVSCEAVWAGHPWVSDSLTNLFIHSLPRSNCREGTDWEGGGPGLRLNIIF